MNRLTYAGYVAMMLRAQGKESDQEERNKYWSHTGRIEHYDRYRAFCRQEKKTPDNPPDGYWESKEEPWHKPTGVAIGLSGVLLWFLGGVISSATGLGKK